MLYYLAVQFVSEVSSLNVLTYHTVRTGGAAVTAFILSLIFGPFVIRGLRALKIGQIIKRDHVENLHALHQGKAGTPTMGGALILLVTVISVLLWARLSNRLLVAALLVFVALAAVGFLDDWLALRKKHNTGLSAKGKFGGQILIGLMLGLYLFYFPVTDAPRHAAVEIPFLREILIPLGFLYVFFVMIVIVGSSNGVNLTDGLDGLAIGASIISILAYTAIAYVVSRADWSSYLFIVHVPEASELTVFGGALLGAGLGFLWFNSHPAEVFMGDTGSLALGGTMGTMACMTKQELVLLLVGGIFVLEAASVILQVGSYKLRGKRIFRMAPIHHHFELMGWSETKVVTRFWILALVFALMSLATLKLR